ncbi:MAG: hypothetical protein V3V02_11495 [Rhizobiaceae bacterium]
MTTKNNSNSRLKFLLLPACIALASCNASTSKAPTTALQSNSASNTNAIYYGKWDGSANTSLEIVSEAPLTVRYCFKKQCANHAPSGTLEDMVFDFPKSAGFRGAKMTMIKNGEVYNGRYQIRGSSNVALATLAQK